MVSPIWRPVTPAFQVLHEAIIDVLVQRYWDSGDFRNAVAQRLTPAIAKYLRKQNPVLGTELGAAKASDPAGEEETRY